MRRRRWAPAGLAAVALLAAACGSPSGSAGAQSSAPGTPAPSSSAAASSAPASLTLKTATTSLGTVLVDAKGQTLYWFSGDTKGTSACTGACAGVWPPAVGAPAAAPGVSLPGKLATISRPGGAAQATYNGHPLYTFSGDTSSGQTKGNGIHSFGGTWHAATVSGPSGASPAPSSTASSGGGYGGGY